MITPTRTSEKEKPPKRRRSKRRRKTAEKPERPFERSNSNNEGADQMADSNASLAKFKGQLRKAEIQAEKQIRAKRKLAAKKRWLQRDRVAEAKRKEEKIRKYRSKRIMRQIENERAQREESEKK